MRLLKLVIISFIFIFLLFTIISLFIPSHIRISKATDIGTARETAMSYISNPERWKEWFPGADSMDILFIEGKPAGLITSPASGIGLVIGEKNDSMVNAANSGARLKKEVTMGWNFFSGSTENVVTVQWHMDFRLRWYPWEKFSSLFYEDIYGAEMEKGLMRLKEVAEASRSSIN